MFSGVGGLISLGLLYVWLKGHWFGAVVPGLFFFWLFQMATGDFHEPGYYIVARGMISAFFAFLPYLLWGQPQRY